MSGGTRSYEMARRLVSMGHEVHIVTTSRETNAGSGWESTNEEGINVHWYPVPYDNSFSNTSRIIAFVKFIVAATLKGFSLSADVVFATSTPLTVAIPGYFISRKLMVPMVFEVRDLWPTLPIAMGALQNPFLRWLAYKLEIFAYAHSARIIALSQGMKEGIISTGFIEDKVTVIPNSCDLDMFGIAAGSDVANQFRIKNNIALDATLIVYAGTFGRINGVDYLVELAKSMDDVPAVAFLVVGQGSEFNSVANLAKDLGVLGNNFHMLGSVSKSDMAQVLSSADIATSLFIPIKEMEANSANKFFDALSASLPVFINYGGWHAQLLLDNEAGLQLNRDVSIASEQIRVFISQPDRIYRFGANARRLGESKFSRDDLAYQLERVLTLSIDEAHGCA